MGKCTNTAPSVALVSPTGPIYVCLVHRWGPNAQTSGVMHKCLFKRTVTPLLNILGLARPGLRLRQVTQAGVTSTPGQTQAKFLSGSTATRPA